MGKKNAKDEKRAIIKYGHHHDSDHERMISHCLHEVKCNQVD